jgi:hypothetical protein
MKCGVGASAPAKNLIGAQVYRGWQRQKVANLFYYYYRLCLHESMAGG